MLPTSQPKTIKEEVAEIVRTWDDLETRAYNERRLQELGDVAVEELVEITRLQMKAKRLRFLIVPMICALTAIMSTLKLWLIPSDLPALESLWDIFAISLILSVLLPLFSATSGIAAQILAEIDDIRTVETLASAWKYKELRSASERALTRLLPQMKSSDAPLLGNQQRKILYNALLRSKNIPFVLALLKSLEQIGDKHALAYVIQLAEPPLGNQVQIMVQQAAKECLPFLMERAEQEQQRSTLLRASDSSVAQPDELLRPVTTNTEIDPMVLLRATQQESGQGSS